MSPEPTVARRHFAPVTPKDPPATRTGWLRQAAAAVIAIVFMTGLGLMLMDAAIALLRFP